MKDHVLNSKVLLVAVCISISACLQVFPDTFIYWRESLLGEFWRLWTAHWVHVGWVHFLFKYDGIRLFTLYFSTYKSMASSKSTFAIATLY